MQRYNDGIVLLHMRRISVADMALIKVKTLCALLKHDMML